MTIGGGGIGHQDRRGTADRQFTEGAGARAAQGQVGPLQQACHLIAEGTLHQAGEAPLAGLRIAAASEQHHPHPRLDQGGQQGSHHAI